MKRLLVLLALALPLAAANRALFVAVSQYDKKISPLPDVQRDLAHMREVAALMGFRDDAICTLPNARTREILESVDSCLVRGATPADFALLYFTLHGSQTPDLNDDEKDGLDEIFITSDTVVWNGRLRNYLLDDDRNKLLASFCRETSNPLQRLQLSDLPAPFAGLGLWRRPSWRLPRLG